MKISHSLPVLFVSLLSVFHTEAQDQKPRQPDEWDDTSWSPGTPDRDTTGLPGDNFSLQGALALFKKAGSPEEFERLLNTEDNKVNNLDLNADGQIDYLRVINKKQNQVQVFIIQALVSNTESQDVAVIELERTNEDDAVIQIAGDEDIYGETTIAEPIDSTATPEGNGFDYSPEPRPYGPSDASLSPTGVVVNVWFWPCVRRVYAPSYVVWTSPWSWINPPVWWRPWRPMPVYAYRPVCHHYYGYGYGYAPMRRIPPAYRMYHPVRTYSGSVYNRNRVIVTNYRATRADRGYNRRGYDGGRYDGYNRNSYYGGRNNYSGRNNYNGGRPSGSYSTPRQVYNPGPTRVPRGGNYGRPGTTENWSSGNGYQTSPGRPGSGWNNGGSGRPGNGGSSRPDNGGYTGGNGRPASGGISRPDNGGNTGGSGRPTGGGSNSGSGRPDNGGSGRPTRTRTR